VDGTEVAEAVDRGRQALVAGRYEEARACFERALESEESAEALDGLGHAARWLADPDAARVARERAYRLYRDRGERERAADVALWLGEDARIVYGDATVAAGWYARSHTLLEGLEDSCVRGWLAVREGDRALLEDGDATVALAESERAIEIGRLHGDSNLEHTGRALRGLAAVALGDVAEGMRELDAASTAAIAGELGATDAGRVWCCLIFACERVRDVQRASEWCATVKRRAEELQNRQLFGYCRSHYASILTASGEWEEAERELAAAADDFAMAAPGVAHEADLALAELRRRQGRSDEARAICERHPSHHQSLLCAAELAWDRGDAARADELLARRNRRLPQRVVDSELPGLDLAVRVGVAIGDLDAARTAAARIDELAATDVSRAAAAYARGICAASRDAGNARRCLEDAIDGWTAAGMPFESARARVALARYLRADGREADADDEVDAAQATLEAVGSKIAVAEMDMPLAAPSSPADRELTAREVEILRHVADGLSDNEIAKRLVLSPHTVHRHVANIRTKLRQPSRAAAAVYAAREGLI